MAAGRSRQARARPPGGSAAQWTSGVTGCAGCGLKGEEILNLRNFPRKTIKYFVASSIFEKKL